MPSQANTRTRVYRPVPYPYSFLVSSNLVYHPLRVLPVPPSIPPFRPSFDFGILQESN